MRFDPPHCRHRIFKRHKTIKTVTRCLTCNIVSTFTTTTARFDGTLEKILGHGEVLVTRRPFAEPSRPADSGAVIAGQQSHEGR